jgi:dipeptidyl aminopeptidase/acylaminoacyl peptidase
MVRIDAQPRRDCAQRVAADICPRRTPPILSIQGDADPLVPFSQNVRLHDALIKAGVKNELISIAGGGHGNFTAEERTKAYVKIRYFLAENGLSIPEIRPKNQ